MKKRKPTLREREAMEAFEALQRKWASVPKFARSSTVKASAPPPAPRIPPGRTTSSHLKSVDTGHMGGTKPVEGLRYTGTKMLGIGTLHKSNAVPVFSSEEATDLARMRRT